MLYTYTMEYYSAIKKDEMMPFTTTWLDLEGIMLNEVSQRKTNTIRYHLYAESKKYSKLVNIAKNKQSHRTDSKLVVSSVGRGQFWGRKVRGMNC